MYLVGYIEPFTKNCFTIPIYSNEEQEYFFHKLDSKFRILSFEKLQAQPRLIQAANTPRISYEIGDIGAIVFISEIRDFIGSADQLIDDLLSLRQKLKGRSMLKEEILGLWLRLNPISARVTQNKIQNTTEGAAKQSFITEKGVYNPFNIPSLRKVHLESQLNPNYTFDNFVEGDCNRLARSAGFAVANNPGGTSFNPLLIYGDNGLGKTHLAHAIGIEIEDRYPEKRVLYVSVEKFTQQFIDSIRNNTTNDFVHFYQMVDILIVDDLQSFALKEKTQNVFFEILNHQHQNGNQVILTSDRAPVDLQGVGQRLLSRFKLGLSADLQVPDLETRIAILNHKLYNDGVDMPKDVIEYLAYSINSNVRELEGALISLLAQSSLNKKKITVDVAKQMIDKFVKNTTRDISIDYIQRVVCDYFDMPIDLLKSSIQKREVVQARQLAMYFANQLTKASLNSIGAQSGNKDYAAVLYACRRVNDLAETDKRFRNYVEDLRKKLTLK